MAASRKTVGVSPKAKVAPAVSAAAVLIAWAAIELFDTKLDVNAVQALLAAVVAAVGAFGGAYGAEPGQVVTERKPGPVVTERKPGPVVTERKRVVRQGREAGYGVIELLVIVILVLVFIWLLFALVD